MSLSAAHESKVLRKHCEACHARKAKFRFRGQVRADRDHTLCFACFRSQRERRRALLLSEVGRPMPSPFGGGVTLSARQVAHRRVMLTHLQSASAAGGVPGGRIQRGWSGRSGHEASNAKERPVGISSPSPTT